MTEQKFDQTSNLLNTNRLPFGRNCLIFDRLAGVPGSQRLKHLRTRDLRSLKNQRLGRRDIEGIRLHGSRRFAVLMVFDCKARKNQRLGRSHRWSVASLSR